jgi:MFS family permease
VGGLDDGPRALALLFYAMGLVTGSLVTGQAASWAQARGYSAMFVPYLGIGGVLLAMAALIAGPQGFWPMVAVWFLFSFCGSVGVAGYAAMGQGFPPELQGRVATAINFAMLVLVFGFQTGIGAILDLFPRTESGGWDPAGYAVALSVTFLLQAGAAAWIVVAPRGAR